MGIISNFVFFQKDSAMKLKALHILLWLVPYCILGQHDIEVVGVLPEEVSETSGLIFYNGKLITHNDSGNIPELFEIDTVSLQVTRRVTISNATNIDWEDITQDNQYIYIGDFGNNKGTRKDLVVYRVSKLDYASSDTVAAERIDFTYEDQNNFEDNGTSDWDAEAMVVIHGHLVVLTKQWKSNGTKAYAFSKVPGSHTARTIGTYNVGGLVTGATYDAFEGTIHVLAHSTILKPFVLKVDGATENSFFGGNVERIDLAIDLSQTEGIAHVTGDTYYVSSERFSPNSLPISLAPQLFKFVSPEMVVEEEEEEEPQEEEPDPAPDPDGENNPEPNDTVDKLTIYSPLGSNVLEYDLRTDKPILAQAIFDLTGRMIHYIPGPEIDDNTIDLNTFEAAIYFLHLYIGDSVMSQSFVRY